MIDNHPPPMLETLQISLVISFSSSGPGVRLVMIRHYLTVRGQGDRQTILEMYCIPIQSNPLQSLARQAPCRVVYRRLSIVNQHQSSVFSLQPQPAWVGASPCEKDQQTKTQITIRTTDLGETGLSSWRNFWLVGNKSSSGEGVSQVKQQVSEPAVPTKYSLD